MVQAVDVNEAPVAPPRRSPLPWVIVGVNLVALLGLVGYMLLGGGDEPADGAKAPEGKSVQSGEGPTSAASTESAERAAAEAPPPPVGAAAGQLGPLLQLESFIVNLNEPGGSRYLKVGIELELRSPEVQEAVEKVRPVIRHRTIAYLSSLTLEQTRGVVAKEQIRLELLSRCNGALGYEGIRGVYFTDFLVQ